MSYRFFVTDFRYCVRHLCPSVFFFVFFVRPVFRLFRAGLASHAGLGVAGLAGQAELARRLSWPGWLVCAGFGGPGCQLLAAGLGQVELAGQAGSEF